jgi:DNA adenine methylase
MLAGYEAHFFPERVTRFVDLFAGGLTMVLWVAERFPDAELVINDGNDELMLLYRSLADEEEATIAAWRSCVQAWLPKTPEERKAFYYELREEYTQRHEATAPSRLAGVLLFMLQTNFNGMWKAYIKCNGRYSTPPGTCLQKAGFFDEGRVRAVAVLLRRATLLAGDFGDVPLRPGDFVYADPPYRDSVVDYQGGFTEADQVRLIDHLRAHDGPFAYSNKDIGDGFYARHFPDERIWDMTATYTAGRGTTVHQVREVLVTNFVSPARPAATAAA